MKYLLTWNTRNNGSATENEADGQRLLELFARWSPPENATFHQFLGRVDGKGGAAVVETDDAATILTDVSIFSPWLEYDVVPVVDIVESAGAAGKAMEFRAGG